jgi:CDP-diacylglycerol--inositol 3-phosphatidyltransferase
MRVLVLRVELTSFKNVLFSVCAFNEIFFIALYLLSFSSPYLMPSLIQPDGELKPLQPGSPVSPSLIWTTPWSAGAMEMARANKMDSTVPWILLWTSCLPMVFKQYVNVVQLMMASRRLAEGDRETRKKTGLPRR